MHPVLVLNCGYECVCTLECSGGDAVLHFRLQLKEFIKSDLMGNVYAAGDQVRCNMQ